MTKTNVSLAQEVGTSQTLHDLARRAGLRLERVVLPNFDLYAVYKEHDFFYTAFCEQYDQPQRWEARSDGEKKAMTVLAMDEWDAYQADKFR